MSLTIFKNINNTFTIMDCYGGGIWEFDKPEFLKFLLILNAHQENLDLGRFVNELMLESIPGETTVKEIYDFILEQKIPLHVTFSAKAVLKNLDKYNSDIITVPFTNMEVSRICNYRCDWCFLDHKTYTLSETLTLTEMIDHIVLPMAELGVIQWGITGGEPSLTLDKTLNLSKEILSTVKSLYKLNPEIILFTNGTNLDKYAESYKKNGITSIQVSLSSGNAELENKLRKPPKGIDSYIEVIKGIEACKKAGLKINLNSVISPDMGLGSNIKTIPVLFEIASKYEVDVFDLSLACPAGEAKKNGLTFTYYEYEQIIELVKKSEGILKSKTHYARPFGNLEEGRDICCGTGMIEFYIDYIGYTYPCNNLSESELRCSSKKITEEDIEDIWFNSSILRRLRNYEKFFVNKECGICKHRGFCVGSCIAKIWHQFGSFNLNEKPDYCYKESFRKENKNESY